MSGGLPLRLRSRLVIAKRLSEIRQLLESTEFASFWKELQRVVAAREEARRQLDEAQAQAMQADVRSELAQRNAIDTLSGAGETEDAAAGTVAEVQKLENRGFTIVADYEELRYQVSESWYRLGAAERKLEEKREAHARAKATVGADLVRAEAELRLAEKGHRQATEEYEREDKRKSRLWDEVERIWVQTAEMSLLVAEKQVQGKKVRRAAARLFAQAEEEKAKARRLREESEAARRAHEQAQGKVRDLLKGAKEKLGAASGEEFLYFRQKESQKGAYAVALVQDSESYNIEVRPLAIYALDRQRGVAFLEPAVEDPRSAEEGDQRFEDYLIRGRKGGPGDKKSA